MTDYMTSAASSSANTSALTSVPNVAQSAFSSFLLMANSADQANTRDDAGLPIVYGSCKLLDMLGYASEEAIARKLDNNLLNDIFRMKGLTENYA